MHISYSRVEGFEKCPFQYKLRYLDELETIQAPEHDNALIVGSALHKGIETNVQDAIDYYYSKYPIITDQHVNEAIKLEILIPKVKELLEGQDIIGYEIPINVHLTRDIYFKGFVDVIVLNQDGTVDVYDFKYSNNVDRYMESKQLHVYKEFLEFMGFKVSKLGFIFVPKTSIRQTKTEDLIQFRKRLKETVMAMKVCPVEVQFSKEKYEQFVGSMNEVLTTDKFPKNQTKLCDWCEYKKYCLEGDDIDMLPKNERRAIEGVSKKTLWLYGAPFSGKTTFANAFPDPLMLNTDGNIKFVDAPFMFIKDQVTLEGRITKRKFAWEVFKDIIAELEKKQNDFKTIVVDLLEDTYEHCRLYMYAKLNIEHESDNSFKAWDMIRTEFLSTIKKLMNLDYENIILISHEDTSKDLTKKTGDKISRIAPNLQEKAANKIAGMVDIVARIVADDGRFMMFKNSEVVFGGGRLKAQTDKINLSFDELQKVYEEAKPNNDKPEPVKEEKKGRKTTKSTVEEVKTERPAEVEQPPVEVEQPQVETPVEEAPKTKRSRRS